MTNETTQHVLARRDAFVAARDIYITATLLEKIDFWFGLPANDVPYRRDHPIFVQYTNPEVLSCYGWKFDGPGSGRLMSHALNATKLAVLLTEQCIVIPASYIFEVPWFHLFLNEIEPLLHDGFVRYTAPVPELSVYLELKAHEYRFDDPNPYSRIELDRIYNDPDLAWLPRNSKATASDIKGMWCAAVQPGGDLDSFRSTMSKMWRQSYGRLDDVLFGVPERLEGQAFIKRFVDRAIPAEIPLFEDKSLALFLSRAYLQSYLIDLDASLLTNLPISDLGCGLSERDAEMDGRLLSARRMKLALRWLEIDEFIYLGAGWTDLLRLSSTVDFGFIMSVLYGRRSTAVFRFATMKAARSRRFQNATSYSGAISNIQAVAAEMSTFIE